MRMLLDFQKDSKAVAAMTAASKATASTTPSAPPSTTATATPSSISGSASSSKSSATVIGVDGDEQDAIAQGMAAVMAAYESELKSPIKNLVLGDLARALLIQVSELVTLLMPVV